MPYSFEHLTVHGVISVKPRRDWTGVRMNVVLLAGPTGAGKSSFIEALAKDRSLRISKNQLECYTQNVTAYEVENVMYNHSGSGERICLLDSPGFSASERSEVEIIHISAVNTILYFCPVTDTRISGTRRRSIEMLKSLIQASGSSTSEITNQGTFVVVTTMWDNVWNERVQQRAEKNFAYFKDNLLKVSPKTAAGVRRISNRLALSLMFVQDMIAKGTGLTKFMNTQKSALDILEAGREHWGRAVGNAYWQQRQDMALGSTEYGRYMYLDLLGRIEVAWQRKMDLQRDITQASRVPDPELKAILGERLFETNRSLQKFATQLRAFGAPPDGMPPIQRDLAEYIDSQNEETTKHVGIVDEIGPMWPSRPATTSNSTRRRSSLFGYNAPSSTKFRRLPGLQMGNGFWNKLFSPKK
ncbi:hypothetical protein CVT24_013367 [Panaeolus cyanescens]|uniref:G domain-containing protein n=1 Tax=Panaeolus cyanescens TaxID=181874 RepID=A0A409YMK5_9AGAR|nr:hypothetical protein CVT24_013367 [Panaeolus cyanescens]